MQSEFKTGTSASPRRYLQLYKINISVLPKTLIDIFKEYTEDDYNLYVTRADFSGEIFALHFALDVQDINEKGPKSQKWRIEAVRPRKNHISFDYAAFMEIETDHPLLWEFTDTQCELYFTGQCKDSTKLFYDLYCLHKRLFGNYQCFNIFFDNVFKYTNGLLTNGSKKLMSVYAACLKENGLDFTIIGERPATYWDGDQFISESSDWKILFLGDTYIIAKEFSFVEEGASSR